MIAQSIPFNRPHLTGNELEYIREAVEMGHLSGDGAFTKRVHAWLAQSFGVTAGLLTHSCTAGLEMCALLAEIGPGDEVIMPSYTFVSTANAFVLRGAIPVFVDIRHDTLNLDETLVRGAITSKTKAIVAVHYAGVGCEMDELSSIAQEHDLWLFEDAAQGVSAKYKGRALGSFGHASALSFHETKNLISGEGGALLETDPDLVERAEILREKGTNRTKFLRGLVDKYRWVDVGSSFLPSEIVAAFLWAQIEHEDALLTRRLEIWDRYYALTEPLERRGVLRRPIVPEHCQHNAHMFYVLADSAEDRARILEGMHRADINAIFHYVPLHSAPAGERFGRAHGSMKQTDDLSARIIRLPLFHDLSHGEQSYIVETLSRQF